MTMARQDVSAIPDCARVVVGCSCHINTQLTQVTLPLSPTGPTRRTRTLTSPQLINHMTTRGPYSKAREQDSRTVSGSSQFSMGQTAQSQTSSIMEKPDTGLDECKRILLLCFRARSSDVDEDAKFNFSTVVTDARIRQNCGTADKNIAKESTNVYTCFENCHWLFFGLQLFGFLFFKQIKPFSCLSSHNQVNRPGPAWPDSPARGEQFVRLVGIRRTQRRVTIHSTLQLQEWQKIGKRELIQNGWHHRQCDPGAFKLDHMQSV